MISVLCYNIKRNQIDRVNDEQIKLKKFVKIYKDFLTINNIGRRLEISPHNINIITITIHKDNIESQNIFLIKKLL